MVRKILPMLLVLIALSLAVCGESGKVEQGRVVKSDPTKTPAVAWISPGFGIAATHPDYSVLPAHAFTITPYPGALGPEPHGGLRVKLDVENKLITMYDFGTNDFDKLSFELVERQDGVNPRRQHPLVWDPATRKERPFPVVKADERTVTIFSRRQEMLVTIKLSEEDFAKYQPADWDAGDEVRIYYKEPGKSLSFMNVTRTDFTKRK